MSVTLILRAQTPADIFIGVTLTSTILITLTLSFGHETGLLPFAGTRIQNHYGTTMVSFQILRYDIVLALLRLAQAFIDTPSPFTMKFPRADIHELLTPDLLHQLIKGMFKDRLISWVEEYLKLTHGPSGGAAILDEIDHQYVRF